MSKDIAPTVVPASDEAATTSPSVAGSVAGQGLQAAYTDLRETLEAVDVACTLMLLAGGPVARVGAALSKDITAALRRADALLGVASQ